MSIDVTKREDVQFPFALSFNKQKPQLFTNLAFRELYKKMGKALEEPQGDRCSKCDGLGYTSEHDPEDPHEYGCNNCPIQVECDDCRATGKKLVEAQPEKGEG